MEVLADDMVLENVLPAKALLADLAYVLLSRVDSLVVLKMLLLLEPRLAEDAWKRTFFRAGRRFLQEPKGVERS